MRGEDDDRRVDIVAFPYFLDIPPGRAARHLAEGALKLGGGARRTARSAAGLPFSCMFPTTGGALVTKTLQRP